MLPLKALHEKIWLFAGILSAICIPFAVVTCGGPSLTIESRGKIYGIGREVCRNAFGHHSDPSIELYFGDKRSLTLWKIDRPCHCSLCKSGLFKP